MPLDRRGRPPAEPRQPSLRRRLARDVEVEYVEHGLDWLAERVEPADAEEAPRVPEPAPGPVAKGDDGPDAAQPQEPAPGPPEPEPAASVPAPPDPAAPAAPEAAVPAQDRVPDQEAAPEAAASPYGAAPEAASAATGGPGPARSADQEAWADAEAAPPRPEVAGRSGDVVSPPAGEETEPADHHQQQEQAPGEAPWLSPAVQALRQVEDDGSDLDEPLPQRLAEPAAHLTASAAPQAPAPDPAASPPPALVAAWHAGPAPARAEAEPPPETAEPVRPAGEYRQPADGGGREDAPLPGWDDLTSERLLARQPGGPTGGWQGLLYRLTGGRVRLRPGRAERARRELEARVTAPIHGYRRIAVLALKGGVGKTTTTACLGATFATHRPDRVVAVDASPDAGTLAGRTRGDGTETAKNLLAGAPPLDRYADVRAYAAQTASGLEVVASEMDPSMSHPFSDADYRKVAAVLERFYSLVLTDCGPGVLHTVMLAVLERADQIIVVSAPSVDGARSAALTLDWLEQHGFEALARSAVVVVNSVRPRGPVNIGQLEEHFSRRCRVVVRIPFDRHLETGSEIELDQLGPGTRQAYVELAAAVADGFDQQVRAHWERSPQG